MNMSAFPSSAAPSCSLHLPTPFSIRSIEVENDRTKTLTLNASLNAAPGQFVMAWLPRFDEKPFSLVAADPVTIMVTAVGPFSNLVHQLQPGDVLWIRGPFGNAFRTRQSSPRAAFVGGGYGVAPLLWLARAWFSQLEALTVIVGARTATDLLYIERFNVLGKEAGNSDGALEVVACTEDGSSGMLGLAVDPLQRHLSAGELDLICACGPHGLLDAIDRLGQQYSVPRQLSWEAYMRCAVGICGACELNGSVLCLDGPVLEHCGS